MKKVLLFLLAIFALCVFATAYSVPDDTTVYVTPNGEKYHRESCSYTSDVKAMTIEAAERKGYTPCSRCDPDILQGEYVSDWDGESGESRRQNSQETSKSPKESQENNAVGWTLLKVFAILFGGYFAIVCVAVLIELLVGIWWTIQEKWKSKK